MHALPFLLALLSAAILAPAVLRTLAEGSHTRLNYRERPLPFPFGVLIVAAALIALIPLVLLARLASSEVFHPELLPIALYALGVAVLGLIDDTLGEARAGLSVASGGAIDQPARPGGDALEEPARPAPRGWRGHARAALRGELSTGTLKAAGSLGLALFAMSFEGLSKPRWLLAVGVLVLATNVFNLLDLRPGRAIKAFVLLGAGLTLGSLDARPLWSLGLFAAPALVAGLYDLRERAMLGDTGANLLGALAGLWLVLTLSQSGQLIALALLVAITLYGELRSISALVERTPGLRALDSWGRPS
jgi:UDP-N-acetylmuramyl pentapeptide phosphotransferase/UDP-N-acetylglucosamine-1-phosphate transferase